MIVVNEHIFIQQTYSVHMKGYGDDCGSDVNAIWSMPWLRLADLHYNRVNANAGSYPCKTRTGRDV